MTQGPASSASRAEATAMAIGLSFFWLFLRRPFFSSLLANLSVFSQECHWIFIFTTAIAAGALLLFGNLSEGALRQSRMAVTLVCACASTFSCALVLLGEAWQPLAIASILFLGLSFVGLACAWAESLVARKPRYVLGVCLVSFLVTCAISTGFLLAAPFPGLLSSLAPALSCGCWLAIRPKRTETPAEKQVLAGRRLPRAFWILALFLLLSSILRGLLYGGAVDGLSTQSTIAPSCIAALLTALLIPLIARSSMEQRVLGNLWRGIIVVFFLGLLLLVVNDQNGVNIGRAVVIASRTILNVFLFACLCLSRNGERQKPPTFLASAFLLIDAASSFLSYGVVPFVVGFASEPLESYIAPCAAIVCFVLVIASYGILGSHLFEERPSVVAPPVSDDDILEELGQVYGLTQREQEIVSLIVEGNTVKKISALLFVAPSTVQSHMKSVYRKMNVHTRQEVVDLWRHRRDGEVDENEQAARNAK